MLDNTHRTAIFYMLNKMTEANYVCHLCILALNLIIFSRERERLTHLASSERLPN